ncbi:MAG: hypothetical protein WC254_00355 [Candidatus Woesearchaeota archaeon]|jgi:hypothetical protein
MKFHKITWTAFIAITFLFIMTASQGKYWGKTEMETYIIQITEGTDETFLDSSTPTAMVVNQRYINPYMKNTKTTYTTDCPFIGEGYVVNNGKKIAKVIVEDCTTEPVQKETKHDTTYS